MKKIIVPILFISLITIVYTTYFSQAEGLGTFADFDPNNNASKDIRVEIVKEKGINQDEANGQSIFYAKDKNGVVFLIQGPLQLPPAIETNSVVTLRGHIHKDYFHAHEVLVK